MKRHYFLGIFLPLIAFLTLGDVRLAQANPNTGAPTNLHRKFVVQQTKRKAAQGKSTRKHVGVWLSGGYNRTVSNARRSSSRSYYRSRRIRRR